MLEPVIGANSVILLDEGDHLEQRKLMLPAFHGEKMQRLSGTMEEVAVREIESWPDGEPLALHPRFQALTLEVILRAVFGLDSGARLDRLRVLLHASSSWWRAHVAAAIPAARARRTRARGGGSSA